MNGVCEVHHPLSALSLSLVSAALVFPILLLFLFILPLCSCFLPSALAVSHTKSIANYFISHSPPSAPPHISFLNVSLSSSSQWISCCQPELKVTFWLGQGLQHRTWVLHLHPARVLCCSQWSCLSSSRPACLLIAAGLSSLNRWTPSHQPWSCWPCSSLYILFEPYIIIILAVTELKI